MDGRTDLQASLLHGDDAEASVVQDDNLVNYFLNLNSPSVLR